MLLRHRAQDCGISTETRGLKTLETHHRVVAKPSIKTGLFRVQNHIHDFLPHEYIRTDGQSDRPTDTQMGEQTDWNSE